jgi:hypothetical protein
VTEPAPASGNRYCERLGVPPPDLTAAVTRRDVRLAHLIVLALLEAGEPLSFDAIAERLERLPLSPRLGGANLRASLRKAWHGQPPIVRDPVDGLYYLDVLAGFEIRHTPGVGPGGAAAWAHAEPDPAVAPRADTDPLTDEEVDAAFRNRWLANVSTVRRAAAIVDAAGAGSLPLDDANRRLEALGGKAARIDERTAASWRSAYLREADGVVHLDTAVSEAAAMRRDVRRLAEPRLRQRASGHQARSRRAAFLEVRRADDRRAMDVAGRTRRALLHVVVLDDVVRAAAIVDAATRGVSLFVGDAVREVPSRLDAYDYLAGVDLRSALRRFGVEPDHWWLAELRPAQRTVRLARDGPAVPVTLQGVVQATTGRRVPAESAAWRTLLEGTPRRVGARLEEEAAALFALYEYGVLHGGVRARRRAGDYLLPVTCTLPGDLEFWSILRTAIRHWSPLDVVLGPSADLAGPWPSATRVDLVEQEGRTLYLMAGEALQVVEAAEVRAIRLVDPAAAADVGPGHDWRHDDRRIRLKVTLDGIAPPIWRRLEVPASLRLERLHAVLQVALGWTNSHLHVFEIGGERIGVPYALDQLTEGLYTRSGRMVELGHVVDKGIRRFTYEYDFGDSWRHTIEVEAVDDDPEGDDWVVCLGGARACPPEDCRGVGGYAELLETLFDPRHPDFEAMREWAGPAFGPERFELAAVNAALQRMRWERWG